MRSSSAARIRGFVNRAICKRWGHAPSENRWVTDDYEEAQCLACGQTVYRPKVTT